MLNTAAATYTCSLETQADMMQQAKTSYFESGAHTHEGPKPEVRLLSPAKWLRIITQLKGVRRLNEVAARGKCASSLTSSLAVCHESIFA